MGAAGIDRTLEFQRLAGIDNDNASHQSRPQSSSFLEQAMELRQGLASLEKLVAAMRANYVQPSYFIRIKGTAARMSEREKDEFDADITDLMKNCALKIDALQDETTLPHASMERVEHEKEVVTSLLEHLKAIAATTKKLQKQRTQLPFLLSHRLLPDDERLALADKENALAMTLAARAAAAEPVADAATPLAAARTPPVETEPHTTAARPAKAPPLSPSGTQRRPPAAARPPPPPPRGIRHVDPVFASQSHEVAFTEEQEHRFHMENVTLHRHFQENFEDAQQIEAKMAEVSNLMSQFTENIVKQQQDIESIHHHAQETSTNIKDSNRILEKTQQIGNGYGFMIFCFYAFFAILLHLLHYFNN